MAAMTPWAFAKALVEAGVLTQETVNRAERIVIDCAWDQPVTLYVKMSGDADGLAKLVPMLEGLVPE